MSLFSFFPILISLLFLFIRFVILLLPGSLTHLLQPWDQIFGTVKAVYYDIMTVARARNFGEVTVPKWIASFESALKATVMGDEGKKAMASCFARCGLWPVDPQKILDRIKQSQELLTRKTPKQIPTVAPSDDPAIDNVLTFSLKTFKSKRKKAAVHAMLEELEKEEDDSSPKKSRRITHPCLVGSEEHRRANDLRDALEAEQAAAKAKREADRETKRQAKEAAKAGAARVRAATQASRKRARELGSHGHPAKKSKKKAPARAATSAAQPPGTSAVPAAPWWHTVPVVVLDASASAT